MVAWRLGCWVYLHIDGHYNDDTYKECSVDNSVPISQAEKKVADQSPAGSKSPQFSYMLLVDKGCQISWNIVVAYPENILLSIFY